MVAGKFNRGSRGLRAALLFCCTGAPLAAQSTAPPAAIPASALAAEIKSLADRAGTIFVGQIVSIEHKPGTVEISFRVEQAVRGAAGPVFVLREWAGLWAPGTSRYVPGQRVLAFLHPAGSSGVSSPVHGAEGLVPVVVQGTDRPQLLDVRRIAASVVRAPGTPLPTEAEGAIQLTDALTLIQSPAAASNPVRFPVPTRGRHPVDLLLVPPTEQAPTPVLRPGSPQLFTPTVGSTDAHR